MVKHIFRISQGEDLRRISLLSFFESAPVRGLKKFVHVQYVDCKFHVSAA